MPEEDDSIHTYVFIDENPEVVLANMKTLENNLNRVLAQNWWQKYIAAAFWSNMSTPINLTIMLLTTLTTGQATTSNLLSSESFVSVSIASLILSVINTFFRPHSQMNDNLEVMRKWQSIGSKFERIYYSKNHDREDYERRLKDYARLQKEVHTLQNSPTPTSQNFFTDLIYYAVSFALVKKQRHLWVNQDGLPERRRSKEELESSV
jgi:hypothetical protein